MEDRSHGACETWCPKWPARGLAANENVCALISMVVWSTARSIRRPDTLMQDRKAARSTKTSCNARPHHTYGAILPIRGSPERWQVSAENDRSLFLNGWTGDGRPRRHGAYHRQLIRRKADISGEARIERCPSPKPASRREVLEPDQHPDAPSAEAIMGATRSKPTIGEPRAHMPRRALSAAAISLDAISVGIDREGGIIVSAIVPA
jgi:hypothetical protein